MMATKRWKRPPPPPRSVPRLMPRYLFRGWSIMFRFLFRTCGLLVLATAFALLVWDGTRSIADSAVLYTNVIEVWTYLHSASLLQFQEMVEENNRRWLLEPMTVAVLNAPAFIVFGALGSIFVLLGSKRKRSQLHSRSHW